MAEHEITILPPERNPVIHTLNGEDALLSADVARIFGKKHLHFLRDIYKIRDKESKITTRNFTPMIEKHANGTIEDHESNTGFMVEPDRGTIKDHEPNTGPMVEPDGGTIKDHEPNTGGMLESGIEEHGLRSQPMIEPGIDDLKTNTGFEIDDFFALNFKEIEIDVAIGSGAMRKTPAYLMTLDGFIHLTTSYRGDKGHMMRRWGLAFFKAAKEEQLRKMKEEHREMIITVKSDCCDFGIAAGHLNRYNPRRRALILYTYLFLYKKYSRKRIAEVLGITIGVVSYILRKCNGDIMDKLSLDLLKKLEKEIIRKDKSGFISSVRDYGTLFIGRSDQHTLLPEVTK